MDALDYRYTYTGADLPVYSLKPAAQEQFILTAAAKGIEAQSLPKDVQTCRSFEMNEAFVDAVNKKARQVYIVHQTARGYVLMPIISAIQVTKSGPYYMVKANNYAFILDTSRLVNETNLATTNSPSNVYFTGVKFRDCRYQYSFRREPARAGVDRADFDFMPGIGIVTDRSGTNSAEALGNQYDLVQINGLLLDNYIEQSCNASAQVQKQRTTNTVSPYTPPLGYDTNYKNTPYNEGNKEEVAAQQNQPPRPETYSTVSNDPFANCPVKPGKGYHVVLPKENLNAIARHYNVKKEDLMKWNNIKNANQIEICQVIWYTKPPKNTQTVAKGDAPAQYSTVSTPKAKVDPIVDQSAWWNNNNPGNNNNGYYTPPAHVTEKPQDYTRPNEYTTTTKVTPQPAAQRAHTVQRGEYLYGIAKKYNCSEDCIRQANNMPKFGDVPLRPGQQLTIPDCSCGSSSAAPAPVQHTTTPKSPETQPQQTPKSGSFLDNTQPVATNPTTSRPAYDQTPTAERPVVYNEGAGTNPKPQPQPQTAQPEAPKMPEAPKFDYTKEYIVRQGDTLRSIAIKHKTNEAELVLINEGLDASKPLQLGQRILVPYRL